MPEKSCCVEFLCCILLPPVVRWGIYILLLMKNQFRTQMSIVSKGIYIATHNEGKSVWYLVFSVAQLSHKQWNVCLTSNFNYHSTYLCVQLFVLIISGNIKSLSFMCHSFCIIACNYDGHFNHGGRYLRAFEQGHLVLWLV